MKKLVAVVVVVIIAVGAYVAYRAVGGTESSAEVQYVVPTLSKDYVNQTYGFALKMPEDFAPQEVAAQDGFEGTTILLQNTKGDGIQIVISPFDEDTGSGYALSQERILKDIPDMKMSDVQPVEVGQNYKGLAFKSDNDAFGGSSRAVWFVFKGNLYQINTYERLDNLLQAMFGTWQFK